MKKTLALLFAIILAAISGTGLVYAQTCNSNTFIYSSDPNTIEYDNIVSGFHSTMAKQADGRVLIWGEKASVTGSNVLTPQEINSTNYPGLTGGVLKYTMASSNLGNVQFAVLTTNGLYLWGTTNVLVSSGLKSGTGFSSQSILTYGGSATNTNGLPDGVNPTDVKMMFGSYGTLAIVTNAGQLWVVSTTGSKNGDGSTTDNKWHRVKKSNTTTLDNVVAVRGNNNLFMALTSDGEVYTWGKGTRIASESADGAPGTDRTYATKMNLPQEASADITPKMIAVTQVKTTIGAPTYYILSSTGNLYSMGDNSEKQLGNFSSTAFTNTWQSVSTALSTPLTNVAWISVQEHDASGGVNPGASALTADGKIYTWGHNAGKMLGGAIEGNSYNPTLLNNGSSGLGTADQVLAAELGGHTLILISRPSKSHF